MPERSLLDYWLILYERRVAIYLVIVTALVSALIIGELVTPVYEARAALYIPAKLAPVSYVSTGSTSSLAREQGSPITTEIAYKPYLGMLKSAQLAQIVNKQFPSKAVSKLLRSDVDFEVTDELMVRVYSRDPDPKLAADVANAYVEGLNQILAESSQAQVDREPKYITAALSRIKDDIKTAEKEVKRFETKHHLTNLDAELSALSNQKSALQDRAEDALVQVAAVRAKKKALEQEVRREAKDMETSELAITTPLVEKLRTELSEALVKLSELEVELGGNNLQLMAQRQRKQDLERQLGDEIRRWLSSQIKPGSTHLEGLRRQYIDVVIEEQRLQAVSEANTRSISRLKERMGAYPDIKAQSAELKAGLDRLQKMRDQLQTNLTEAQLQTDRQMHLVVQLDHALPPGKPAFPIWWLNLSVALFAGLLAGIGYAFFLNYLDETRNVRTLRLVRAILDRSGNGPNRPMAGRVTDAGEP